MRLTRLVGCCIIAAILFEIYKNMPFTQVEENRENAESLSEGVLFHENSKILLAKKFFPIEFLIPLPQYNFTLKTNYEKLLRKLKNMWHKPFLFCPLNFSTKSQQNTTGFNVDWILQKIENEVVIARTEVS